MTERVPVWDALKERSKAKFDADRARFMAQRPAPISGMVACFAIQQPNVYQVVGW